MAHTQTLYAEAGNKTVTYGMYNVTFLVNETKTKLTRTFDSPVFARKFVQKLKHSKRCTLVSAPLFE